MIDLGELRDSVARSGTASMDDATFHEVAVLGRQEYDALFPTLKLHAPGEAFSFSDLTEGPWRKLAVGSANGLGESYAQVLQTTYFSQQGSGYPNLKILFNKLISLRNELLGLTADFGSVPRRDGFWNACRIHHYPSGGGFMVQHRDTHFPKILGESDVPFLQVMCLLSMRGVDFQTGGSFVRLRDGSQHWPENESVIGTVVMFDGSIEHGVADIDPDLVMDFGSSRGRIAAFVNLYETRS